jgi:two-component system, OmpR family, sensor histidine kinase ChvG
MLDRPKDIEVPERLDADDASELQDAITRAKPQGSFFDRFAPGSLTARIFIINILGMAMLAFGIIYFNQFRQSLIDTKAQSLRTQAQIMAAAIAGSATTDTSTIVINPNTLQDNADALAETDNPDGADFPINPETAGSVLKRLVANTGNRAQIIDPDGNLLVDSNFLVGGDFIETGRAASGQQNLLVRIWNWILGRIFTLDYPPRVEYGVDKNRDYPEVAAALNGASVSQVRLDENHEIIVVVAVPVQRFRAVLGALVLSNPGGEIDNVLRAEHKVVALTFGLVTLMSLLLSALLASTIANPIRKLSAATRTIRRGISKRAEIPDFTKRKDEIGDLSGSLSNMTNALYRRIDAIEAFAADVSHELKNPLTSLRSAVETLEIVKKDEQRSRLIDIVKQDVRRMDRLITDISDASRLDAELARNETKPVDLARLIAAIVTMANELGDDKKPEILLTVQPPPAGEEQSERYKIIGQDSRLSQVFRNLIDNAVSFTAPASKIHVRLRRAAKVIEVRVEDNGPGIRLENLERVFERFYTDRPETSFGNNSGLGLAISRQIVEAHSGKIWAENRLGAKNAEGQRQVAGARFTVQLPAFEESSEST